MRTIDQIANRIAEREYERKNGWFPLARDIKAALRRVQLAERKACKAFVNRGLGSPAFDNDAKARDAKARKR